MGTTLIGQTGRSAAGRAAGELKPGSVHVPTPFRTTAVEIARRLDRQQKRSIAIRSPAQVKG